MTLKYKKEGNYYNLDIKGNKKKSDDCKNEKIEILDHQINILFLAIEELQKYRRKEQDKELMLKELEK